MSRARLTSTVCLGRPQQTDVAPVSADAEGGAHALGVPAHLAHDMGAVAPGEFRDLVLDAAAQGIEAIVRPHPAGEFASSLVRFDCDHSGRARHAGDPDREQSDRAAPHHGHDFPPPRRCAEPYGTRSRVGRTGPRGRH